MLPADSPRRAQETTEDPRADGFEFDEHALERVRRLHRPDGTNMLDHALALFDTTSAEALASMHDALERSDAPALRFAAHKLKSSCANLGAVAMASMCRELEQRAQAGKVARCDVLVAEIEEQRRRVTGWIEERLRASA